MENPSSAICEAKHRNKCDVLEKKWRSMIYRKLRVGGRFFRRGGRFALFAAALVEEVIENVHRHREDDGRVVLRRDAAQRLKVAKLEGEKIRRNFTQWHHKSCFKLCGVT